MAAQPKALPIEEPNYLEGGLITWFNTVDHKKVAMLYAIASLTFMAMGGIEALLIRIQLFYPDNHFVSAEFYNELFTMHGTTMIFLVVMPLLLGFLANFLIPLMIGARDVAFPRLNALSFWIFLFGGIFLHLGFFWHNGGFPNAGWFGYANLTERMYTPGLHIDFWDVGLIISGVATVMTAVNFLATIVCMRAPGMTYMRMPLFVWTMLVTVVLILLAFPALTVGLIFLFLDRFFGAHFYQAMEGATPILWQHLFWLFGHPEVYIMALPAFGIISEMLPTFARKPLFGYPMMVYSVILIAFLSYGVWGHHMFATGMGPVADSAFAITSMLIAIPTGIKIFSWIATVWGGSLRMTTAMYFALAFILEFTIGGLTGIMFASPPVDLQQTDSYIIVAHFHYVLFGGVAFAIFGALLLLVAEDDRTHARRAPRQAGVLAHRHRLSTAPSFRCTSLGSGACRGASTPTLPRWAGRSSISSRRSARSFWACVSGVVHQHHQEPDQWRARARRSVGWTRPRMGNHVAATAV